MQPEHGGRIILRRLDVNAEAARYSFEALTNERVWSGLAEVIRAEGSVKLGQWKDDAAPPEWLCELARSALRVAWRGSNEASRWPQRITRWRLENTARG
jgi:hypothetical protein